MLGRRVDLKRFKGKITFIEQTEPFLARQAIICSNIKDKFNPSVLADDFS